MAEPKVKVYGLVWMTRRTYLTIQVVSLVCLLVLLTVMVVVAGKPRLEPEPGQALPPFVVAVDLFFVALPWIILVSLLLVGIETWIVLRKFKQLEAQAELQPSPPGEPGASATGVGPPVADAPGSPATP